MLNRYPLWKYLMVAFALIIGGLYALPNLYGEDPAVQISGARGAPADLATMDTVEKLLEQNQITPKGVSLENGTVLVRLNNLEQQSLAREALLKGLDRDRFVVALNLAPATPAWLQSIGANPMKLGLDLRGGVHFLMEVDMDAALKRLLTQQEDGFRSELREAKIRYRSIDVNAQNIVIRLRSEADIDKAYDLLREKTQDMQFAVNRSAMSITANYSEAYLQQMANDAVEQNIQILRSRVNELGVAEPVVVRQGANRIVVQLPGVQDTARAKEILGATATLEFREVNTNADLNAAARGRVPADSELFKDRNGQPVVLYKRVILTGTHISGASSGVDQQTGMPQVNIQLDGEGGAKMKAFTRNAVGKLMATVFAEYKDNGKRDPDGKVILEKHEEVINQATIQAVLGSSFRITGIDSAAEAHNLALLLRAGALIAPITIVEERTIGPSMGQQNIDMGIQACVWGMIAVMVFTLLYYRGFGLVACFALGMNLVLIIGIMSMIPGATMTLPGIAGIVLTVGMAVDANVLIFERIREELREGRNPQQAINEGYSNAFSTIADANITTFMTALILFAVGTGAIKGFAVTLMIGIATSMFTAIVGTRAIVNLVVGGKRIKKLYI
ncbi:Protein translocase subunit SecD [Vibrio stylophorae]|uniref:Protein translocase subunit SecD n=1 Tax=Vibrio stylophorae TaxID=659351 RepID=A0ABM8ZRW2_9VIBR|nr:protein translocase subunit SecD [Vibrio stylophorae]CAH0532847.1 Protein translocase subunit SecD [Vibrio stylophorae]